ncbi:MULTISPECIES: eCIS core domain-containing protein [Cyanophyceae]|uniref:eCIS core domain-containing protein n=1 Tax=Cyanophyceae TaxID=3028117 RepID=UPI0016897479|nr:DUF4157 domain-containing protein [Trichocoleus sp. FACHB-69]MBD1934454.1 DUF4157 domain-containing protein [Trichocoleus sp. FACHB-69]
MSEIAPPQSKAASTTLPPAREVQPELMRSRPFAEETTQTTASSGVATVQQSPDPPPPPDLSQLETERRCGFDFNRVKVSGAPPVVQPKLVIGKPGDKYEQEADSMAAQVMAMPEPAVPQVQSKLFGNVSDRNIQRSSQTQAAFPEPNALIKRFTAPDKRQQQQQPIQTNSLLQRSIAASNDASRHLESRLSSSKGGGSPLSEEVRSFMEPRFGADFSSVRTHTDSNAIQMNKELGAQAFAHGSNIYFAEGKSPGKDELTAHELTHTIQQGGGLPVKTFSNQPHKGNKLQAKVDFSQPSIHLKENRQEQPVGKEAEPAPQAAPSSPMADVTLAGQQAKSIAIPAKTIEKPLGGGAGAPSIPAGSSEGGVAVTSPEGIKQAVSDGGAIASSGMNGASSTTSSEGGAAVASPEGIKQAASDGGAIASSGMDGGSSATSSEGGAAVASPEGIKQAASDGGAIASSGMDGGSFATSTEGGAAVTSPEGIKQPVSDGEAIPAGSSEGGGGAVASPEGIKQAVSDGGAIASEGMDGGSSATSPENDPGFKAVTNRTKSVAQQQKQHQPAGAKSAEAQAAAVPPGNEVESEAQDKQVQEMNLEQPGQFNAATFKAALMEKIAAVTPQTLEEADNFKNNNKIDSVKGELSSKVTEEKKQASSPIEEKVKEQPDTSGIAPKPVTPLTPEKAGSPPSDIGAEKAAPKPKPASEVSLQEGSQSLDQQMIEANVTEEQLASSNESQFQGALKAKQDAQTNAVTAPQEYRQQEQGILKQAQAEAQTTAQTQLQGMHGSKEQALAQVLGSQGETKTKEEQERANVATKINGFYQTTKSEVETILNNLDNEVIGKFDAGAAAAKQKFETFVAPYMEDYKERYDGLFGAGRWIKDKLLGVPSEVTAFFKEGRELYLAEMDKTINEIANHVATQLNLAKQKIADGKLQIQDYVAKLPENLRQVGQEAAQDIQSKFDELESSVDNKQNELVDSLAQKYNENLQQLDAQLAEMKASNRTWMDKALDAVGGVIKTIAELKNLLMGVLAKAAGAIENIIKDPIGFLGNLVSGLKQGFENFMGNILEHLKKGMLGWLTGAIAGAGITMPESLDMKGIFSLVTQVLGTVYENIRPRAVKRMGEKAVNFVEANFEMFVILKNEGIAGLWQFIQDQIGDLKVMVIDNIQNFVVDGIIKGGVMWILSLLNPASAFVKACKAIYDIIMFFIERGSQIAELVNAVMESVTAIASGAVGGAAKLVENALSKALPVVISFMASLLGLGGISEKIQAIVQKVRQPIEKAIDWVIAQAVKFAKKIGGKLGFGKDKRDKKGKEEEGQEGEIKAADSKKHEAIANKIYEELKLDEETSEGFNQYFKSKQKQAKKLKKYYSSQLKKGIKLTIEIEKIKQTNKQESGLKLHVLIKPNDTEKDYEIFHKEGELDTPIDNLIERALEAVSDKFYKGKSEEDEESDPLPRGIQRTIASIQRDYGRATTDKNNAIEVGGNKFFVDQDPVRNNYVYPYNAAEAATITKKDGKITTDKEVKGYEYSKFNLTVGSLLNLLRNIHESRTTPANNTAMLVASLVAEPFRYSPSHITNLIALNNPANASQPAFNIMAMTTGGTDPRSSKNVEKDPNKKGTVPKKVRERQISIVKNDSELYERIESYYNTNKSKKNENQIIQKFRNIIQDYLNQIQ